MNIFSSEHLFILFCNFVNHGMNPQSKLWKLISQQNYREPIPPGAGELSAANQTLRLRRDYSRWS